MEARLLATALQAARKVNECLRGRPEARFFRGDERDRRALNTIAISFDRVGSSERKCRALTF